MYTLNNAILFFICIHKHITHLVNDDIKLNGQTTNITYIIKNDCHIRMQFSADYTPQVLILFFFFYQDSITVHCCSELFVILHLYNVI